MRSKTERPTGPMMMVTMFVVALVAASCGGAGGGAVEAAEDWHALLVEDGLTSAQADCVIDGLAEIGLSPGDITDEALGDDEVPEAAVDVMFGCIMGRDASTLLDGVEVPDIEIDEDPFGDDADLSQISAGTDLAQVEADFARFADDSLPGGYGEDASLDALWDECEAGDARSCDQLFWSSPLGSTYEIFGMTCGGRFEASPMSCVHQAN